MTLRHLLFAVSILAAPPSHRQVYPPNPSHQFLLDTYDGSNSISGADTRGGATPTVGDVTAGQTRMLTSSLGAASTTSTVLAIGQAPTVSSGNYQIVTTAAGNGAGVRLGRDVDFVTTATDGLDGVAWSGTATVTADNATGLNGSANAETVADSSVGATQSIAQSFTAATSGTWTFSAWVSCGSAHQFSLEIAIGEGATPVTTTTAFTCGATLTQYRVSVTNDGSDTNGVVRIYPASANVAAVDSIVVSRAMTYARAYPLLVFPLQTAGAATDLAATTLTYSSVAFTDVGTYCMWVFPALGGSSGSTQPLWEWDGTDDFSVFLNDTEQVRVSTNTTLVDNVQVTTSTTVTENAWNHVCVTWDQVAAAATGVKVYINGAEAAYSAQDGAFDASGAYGTTLSLGMDKGSGAGEMLQARHQYWKGRALGASAIKRIYDQGVQRGY